MSESQRLIDEAAGWMVLVHSGRASEAQLAAFREWRRSDQAHERICARMEERLSLFRVPAASGLAAGRVRQVIEAPASRRQFLTGSLALGGLAAGTALLGGSGNLPLLGADLHTGIGERKSLVLADGTQLFLNARSAVDVLFDQAQRRLHLRGGEILARVAASGPAPFRVTTPFGEVQPLGDSLLVRHDDYSEAVALGSPLMVRSRFGAEIQLPAERRVRFDPAGLGSPQEVQERADAWLHGNLEVRNGTLGEVVESMRAYRRGFIRVSERAAALRVTGRFDLDNSEQMLDALAYALPIRLSRISRFWVSIDLA